MEEGKKSGSDRCAVCGAHAERGRMCECCRESLALCDMENWLERKEEKKIAPRAVQTLLNERVLWYNLRKINARNTDMKVFAVSDLHLPGNQDKPMDVFGGNWTDHLEKIKRDWSEKVGEEDVVLIAGDLSWAMAMQDGIDDLRKLCGLPGKKVFIRGNHDYWWSGITALRRGAPDESFFFLQNDSVRIGEYLICGSRGWACPGSADFAQSDEKIYLREAERFRLAFQSVKKQRAEGDKLIVMIHYPPFNAKREDSLFTSLFEENGADAVVYGHLHQNAGAYPLVCDRGGVRYHLTSCDLLGFRLAQIF